MSNAKARVRRARSSRTESKSITASPTKVTYESMPTKVTYESTFRSIAARTSNQNKMSDG